MTGTTSSTTLIRDTIVDTITRLGSGTSFAEILRDLERAGIDPSGHVAVANDDLWDRNIVLWANLSDEVVDELADLVGNQVIEYSPTSYLVYLVDGRMLSLPIAKQPRRHYKSLRWLPVTLGPGPHPVARPQAASPHLDRSPRCPRHLTPGGRRRHRAPRQ
jgi:hypothetical protein